MTRINEYLRGLVKDVELAAVQCLNFQPHDDMKCEHHLRKCLTKIADMVGVFRGLVEVEAYDIDWDTDGEKVKLPKSVKLMMNPSEDISETISDRLSDQTGWCANTFRWRLT